MASQCRSHGNKNTWASTFLCLAHFCIMVKSFCIPSSPPRCIVSFKKAKLKRCHDAAANLCHCYLSGDSYFSVIIQQRRSCCATGVRCKSSQWVLGGKVFADSSSQQTCLQDATAAQGSCSPVDISCLCTSAMYLDTLACCLAKNCSPADQTGTQLLRERHLNVC